MEEWLKPLEEWLKPLPSSSLQNWLKNTTIPEKNPQKYNRSWKIFVFRRQYLSSRAAGVHL